MPLINVRLVEKVFDKEKKKELLKKISDAVDSTYPGLQDVTFVTIEEVEEECWGIGGQPITREKVLEHVRKNLHE